GQEMDGTDIVCLNRISSVTTNGADGLQIRVGSNQGKTGQDDLLALCLQLLSNGKPVRQAHFSALWADRFTQIYRVDRPLRRLGIEIHNTLSGPEEGNRC